LVSTSAKKEVFSAKASNDFLIDVVLYLNFILAMLGVASRILALRKSGEQP
jgi:hypothetical protein